MKPLEDVWPFAAVTAAGIGIFFVVRLLLPTGGEALAPVDAIPAEPPPAVFSVAVPGAPQRKVVKQAQPEPAVARLVSRPVAPVPQARPATPGAAKPQKRATPKPPAPAPRPQPQPRPEPQPPPEPVRVLAFASPPPPPPAPNPSPGRAKQGKPPPPGQTKREAPPAPVVTAAVVAAEDEEDLAAPAENPSPGRERHGKGLPPGHAKTS